MNKTTQLSMLFSVCILLPVGACAQPTNALPTVDCQQIVFYSDEQPVTSPEGLSVDVMELQLVTVDNGRVQEVGYAASFLKVTLAEGARPIGSYRYTAEDLEAGLLDLAKVYENAQRAPQAGDRLVVEFSQQTGDIAANTIGIGQGPVSIPLH